MAVVNYRIGNKALFFPPVVFCFVWAADLTLVWLAGNFFYPLSAATLFIFVFGALAFSLGAYVALCHPQKAPASNRGSIESSDRVLSLLVLVAVAAIPFFYRWITSLTAESGVNFLFAARSATANEMNAGLAASFFMNLVTFATIVAIIAFCEGGKKRTFIAIGAALVLNLLTGARAGAMTLILCFLCIDWMKNRRVRWKPLVVMVLALVISFSVIAVYVQTGETRADASLGDNLVPIAQAFIDYAAGGLPAFSQVVERPHIISHNWQIYNPVLLILNHLGAHFEVAGPNAEFLNIGPEGLTTNVYTIYFAYIDFGWLGTMLFMFGIGFLVSHVYLHAMSGGKILTVFYSYLFASIILSPFSDYFFMAFNFSSKLLAISWIVYGLPFRWSQFRALCASGAKVNLSARHHDPTNIAGLP